MVDDDGCYTRDAGASLTGLNVLDDAGAKGIYHYTSLYSPPILTNSSVILDVDVEIHVYFAIGKVAHLNGVNC